MKTQDSLGKQIYSLKWKLRVTYLLFGFLMMAQFAIFTNVNSKASEDGLSNADKVLKTRGLIIVDDQGRERILIGAPIPPAANRVRTDLKRVKEEWAGRFPKPERFMKSYEKYNHNANGIVVLDENGFDRVVLGDVPDLNVGKRIGTSNGIAINDEKGFERGGFGLLNVRGKKRVILGLDTRKGFEGISLGVVDGGAIGMNIYDESRKKKIFIGNASPGHWYTKLDEPFNGLLFLDQQKHKYKLNLLTKP
ncbi:MAG: hypothetical protein HKN25_11460 [Pyrinomonadaceae bacterium]|nr:hypothetical protein [Pyrinomonadaceae bacterium]